MGSERESGHQAVLADELLDVLALESEGFYLDATYGRGGHSGAVLQRLGQTGRLFAYDKDPDACADARERFGNDPRFHIQQGSYTDMSALLNQGFAERFSGVFFDLGVSSPQLDDADRGFSFQTDGPLDMRMNPAAGISAAEWLAQADKETLADVLRRYGEERYADKIAEAIKKSRYTLQTTQQLARLIASVPGGPPSNIHPATRVFLAIRLYLNRELEDLTAALVSAMHLLKVGGRLVVISFHSLEDRIAKGFVQRFAVPNSPPKAVPLAADSSEVFLKKIGRLVRPSAREIELNPRARSARLRCVEKIKSSHPSENKG